MSPKRYLDLEHDEIKKRNRKSVSLEIKLDVLRRIEASEKITDISKALGLAKSTVQTIRANKDKINAYSQSAASLSISKLPRQRSTNMERMEKLLTIWIEDNNQRRMPMSQMAIQEKAKSIFQDLKSEDTSEGSADETFVASRGWYEKFKNRHNFYNIKMKGEVAIADADAALAYPEILKSIIDRGGYIPQQVFNVAETALYWKRMPEGTYISKNERAFNEERLTLLLGANAAGDFKLKPFLVYGSENPTALNRLNKNKKVCMTKSVFEDWFKNYFCPHVKKYLQEKNVSNKSLLLLDNAPWHPVNLSELSEDVEIVYLPKNITTHIQPMDQGAIAAFKAYYLQRIFRKLINATDGESSIEQFWKQFNIKNAVDTISESWNELTSTTMNNVWKKSWPECITSNVSEIESLPEITQNILKLANELDFEDVEEQDVINLLGTDRNPLSNEELMQFETNCTFDKAQEEPVVFRQLTSNDLSNALAHFEQGINILLQNDPNERRSAKVSHGINKLINCYKELHKERKWEAIQQTIIYLKPEPQTTDSDTD